jgi:DMSO/TMAO reductase YedYZ heme-binding membrane subunit
MPSQSITRRGYYLLGGIGAAYGLVIALFLRTPAADAADFVIRLCALVGLLSLSIAALMTPFLRQIYTLFGRPFIAVHHSFALLGLACATIHPLSLAVSRTDFSVFIPDLNAFWDFAGRQALIILYIALIFGIFREKISKKWRIGHALVYLVLLFGFIHGTLIGTDFTPFLTALYGVLFLSSIGVFAYKRWFTYKKSIKG